MSDLVSRLSETLDELERIATEAVDGGSGEWAVGLGHIPGILRDAGTLFPVVYAEGAPTEEQFTHIARWDPKAVLGLVAAVRDVINEHRYALQNLREAEEADAPVHMLVLEQTRAKVLLWTLVKLISGLSEED